MNLQRWAALERSKLILPKLRQKSAGGCAQRYEHQPALKGNFNGNAVSPYGPNSQRSRIMMQPSAIAGETSATPSAVRCNR